MGHYTQKATGEAAAAAASGTALYEGAYMSQWTDDEEMFTSPVVITPAPATTIKETCRTLMRIAAFIFGPVALLVGMLKPKGDVMKAFAFARNSKGMII